MAGSSHTITSHRYPRADGSSPLGEVVTAFVGDDATGAVPDLSIELPVDAELLSILTNPGATAPTANYDIVINDPNSLDVLQGAGANRHTSNTEQAAIVFASTSVHPVVLGGTALTIVISNQAVNSATGTITLRYRRA